MVLLHTVAKPLVSGAMASQSSASKEHYERQPFLANSWMKKSILERVALMLSGRKSPAEKASIDLITLPFNYIVCPKNLFSPVVQAVRDRKGHAKVTPPCLADVTVVTKHTALELR